MKISKVVLLGVIIIAVLISGCIGGGFEGKYISEESPKEYIEIHKDGTFYAYTCSSYLSNLCSGVSGEWKKQGDEIIFSNSWGAGKGKLNGNVLMDEEGKRWIREGKYIPFEKRYKYEGKYLKGNNPDYSLELRNDHAYTQITNVRYIVSGEISHQYKEWGAWKIKGNKVVFSISGSDMAGISQGEYSYEIKEDGGKLKLMGLLSEWIKQ